MHAKWVCRSCNQQIEAEEIEAHEAEGHDVKGLLRPERLLPNDPWTGGDRDRSPNAGSTRDDSTGGPQLDESLTDSDEEVID